MDIEAKHEKARKKFFNNAVILLEKYSWSEQMISEINKKCDFIKDYHLILFPEGENQIVIEFDMWLNEQMLSKLSTNKDIKKIREKIALALEERIINLMKKEAFLNHDSYNLAITTKSATKSCDIIWRYAGDKSTDFNFYTKRGLLLTVYLTAKTYYYADNSKNYENTRKFIRDSLDKIVSVASIKNKFQLPKLEDIPILRMFS